MHGADDDRGDVFRQPEFEQVLESRARLIVPSRNWFARTLKKAGSLYRFISARDIESYYYESQDYNSCCHVCFDDGERSVYENAFPVLKEMKIPATVFLSPKIIREEANYWFQELRHIRSRVGDGVVKEQVCETVGCRHEQINKYHVLAILKCMKLADILRVIEAVKEQHNLTIVGRHNIT